MFVRDVAPEQDRVGALRGGERPLEGVGGNAVPPRGRLPPFIDERTALRAYRLKTKEKK